MPSLHMLINLHVVHTCLDTHVHTHAYTYVHTHTQVHTHTHMHTHAQAHTGCLHHVVSGDHGFVVFWALLLPVAFYSGSVNIQHSRGNVLI